MYRHAARRSSTRTSLFLAIATALLAVLSLTTMSRPTPDAQAASLPVLGPTTLELLNTGRGSDGLPLTSGTDPLWKEVALPPDSTFANLSGATWSSATVVDFTKTWLGGAWANGAAAGIPGASWIALADDASYSDAANSDCGAFFYKVDVLLDQRVDPAAFAPVMSFLADNAVLDVYVNGVAQGVAPVPNNPDYPFYYWGFIAENAVSIPVSKGWRAGANTVVVHTVSCGEQGFLASFPSIPEVLASATLTQTYNRKEWGLPKRTPRLDVILGRMGGSVSVGGGSNVWTLSSVDEVRRNLPGSGRIATLSDSGTNPRNNLAGQAIAAKLNVAGYPGLGSQVIRSGPYAGQTVDALLAAADAALAGPATAQKVLVDLTTAVTQVNTAYAGGTSSGFLVPR